ncbi:MAG: hypothetical protein WDZ35_01630 [Crocinitomicaceae bacterium]
MLKNILLLSSLFLIFSFVSASNGEKCPKCLMPLQKTYQTKAEWGKILYEHKCLNDHVFWYPNSQKLKKNHEQNQSNDKCDCPVCGFHGFITGNPKVKKCMNNHEFACD